MTKYTVPEARNVAWHDRANRETRPCSAEQLSAALQALDAEVERLRSAFAQEEAECARWHARCIAAEGEVERLREELAQTQRDRQAEHDARVKLAGEVETMDGREALVQEVIRLIRAEDDGSDRSGGAHLFAACRRLEEWKP